MSWSGGGSGNCQSNDYENIKEHVRVVKQCEKIQTIRTCRTFRLGVLGHSRCNADAYPVWHTTIRRSSSYSSSILDIWRPRQNRFDICVVWSRRSRSQPWLIMQGVGESPHVHPQHCASPPEMYCVFQPILLNTRSSVSDFSDTMYTDNTCLPPNTAPAHFTTHRFTSTQSVSKQNSCSGLFWEQ